jgi:lipopolysaccharide biosynthesis protein
VADTATAKSRPQPAFGPRSTEGRHARVVATYLPQFHPIPENDRWWGEGFTEWSNVTRAVRLFGGHRQPRIPGSLGFYDLRLPDTRCRQAEMALAHGIEAFCYWHYWFQGTRLLGRPFDEVLRTGEPNFPFCLAWANEPWTRTWLGQGEVLMAQRYSAEDDLAHARWLLPSWADPRWLRVDGRPVFIIYCPNDLPEPRRTTDVLRDQAVRAGLPEPLLLGMNAKDKLRDFRTIGFDATIDFRPQLSDLPFSTVSGPRKGKLRRNLRLRVWDPRLRVYGAEEALGLMDRRRGRLDHPVIPCVFSGWDNSPRRGRQGTIVVGYTPERFAGSLAEAVALVADQPADQRLVFVNGWNEWAEGNYLEPDTDEGTARLSALRSVVVARS